MQFLFVQSKGLSLEHIETIQTIRLLEIVISLQSEKGLLI